MNARLESLGSDGSKARVVLQKGNLSYEDLKAALLEVPEHEYVFLHSQDGNGETFMLFLHHVPVLKAEVRGAKDATELTFYRRGLQFRKVIDDYIRAIQELESEAVPQLRFAWS